MNAEITEKLKEEFTELYDEYDDKKRIFELLLDSFMEIAYDNVELSLKIDVLEQKLMSLLGATKNNLGETLQLADIITSLKSLKKEVVEKKLSEDKRNHG